MSLTLGKFGKLLALFIWIITNYAMGDESQCPGLNCGAMTSVPSLNAIATPGVVSLLAGSSDGPGSSDGALAKAQFGYASYGGVILKGITSDANGNVYVADVSNHTIRKISPQGIVTTIAGQPGNSGGNDGPGAQARFKFPTGIAVDKHGNLYVADTGNYTIRKISPSGVVSTFAGKMGVQGMEDGPGWSASFRCPRGIAINDKGELFVVDSGNSSIRKISTAGVVSTFAGTSRKIGFNNGVGSNASFGAPTDLVIDPLGVMYVTDTGNHAIRRITPSAVVSTLTGLDVSMSDVDGLLNSARFSDPAGIGMDKKGNLYVSDANKIRKISMDGYVSTFAGQDLAGSNDGQGLFASFLSPGGITVTKNGDLYIADDFLVRKITPAGMVTTYAGQKKIKKSEDGVAGRARFNAPEDMAADKSGNVYVIDGTRDSVRKIDLSGKTTTLVGGLLSHGDAKGMGLITTSTNFVGIAIDQLNNVYVSDVGSHVIFKITQKGRITTFAGIAGQSGSNDGTVRNARFNGPGSMVFDKTGNLFVVDSAAIRKIDGSGNVTTFAGSSNFGKITPDHERFDAVGHAARFQNIYGLTVDDSGNLYVADGDAIRKITAEGVVKTIGEFGEIIMVFNDFGAIFQPTSIAIDQDGNIFYTIGATIRKINTHGVISVVAGGKNKYELQPGQRSVLGYLSSMVMINNKTIAVLCGNAVLKIGLN